MKPADSVDEVLTRDQKRVMARVLEQEETATRRSQER
jgi:hypothetical protein